MDDPVRSDVARLFQANPLLRDTSEVIANRVGRSVEDVQKALQDLESAGQVGARWVGGKPLYYFTGLASAPSSEAEPARPARLPRKQPDLTARLIVPSTPEGVHLCRAALEGLCSAAHMNPGRLMEFAIALSEALTNAYRYGRRGDDKDVVRAEFRLVERRVEIRITDRGSGFPFVLVGASKGDVRSTGGRGIMLMRSLCDSMEIRRTSAGTVVVLIKNLDAPSVAAPSMAAPSVAAPTMAAPTMAVPSADGLAPPVPSAAAPDAATGK